MMKPADLFIKKVFDDLTQKLTVRTDRMFAWILAIEWTLVAVTALAENFRPQFHEHHGGHAWLAGIVATVAFAIPFWLLNNRPGTRLSRCAIAVAQMIFSVLFVFLAGGRTEMHFHFFVSLAFLSFYRDPVPLAFAAATAIMAHFVPGLCFGGAMHLAGIPWRAFEHGSWVVFESAVLIISIKASRETLWLAAEQQVTIERTLSAVEVIVEARTRELEAAQAVVTEQQAALVNSSKLSALGEMAGGIAHEINTPLAVISMRAEQLGECLADGDIREEDIRDTVEVINTTVSRITKIVNGLRVVSHEGKKDAMEIVLIGPIIDDTLSFCRERFSNHGVQLHVDLDGDKTIRAACRSIQLSQVLLNLLNNAYDAIQPLSEKWVRIELKELPDAITISITDSGKGIPAEIRDKMMNPFFTTKDVGKGTGLGLSISQSIMNDHNGSLLIDENAPNTRFVLWMPKLYELHLGQAV